MSDFHKLKVEKVVRETGECVTIYFEVPENLADTFLHNAGQYLTLKADINENEVRRAYSICTAPSENGVGVSVKKVKNGLMSTYLNANLSAGDELEVMSPDGKFVVKTDRMSQRDHYFFAAGSGITPIMSMIKTVLEEEPKSTCYLLYGNRDEDNIIFKSMLDDMQIKYDGQLMVRHTLSQPLKEKKGGLFGAFSKGKISWSGAVGRINKNILDKWMDEAQSKTGNNEYYICGPSGMISMVKSYLQNMDAAEADIHVEYFTAADSDKKDVASADGATLVATIEGETHEVSVPKGKSLLDSLLDQKIDAPFSCTSGACSTCMAKVIEGSADMEACFALDDDEVADGFILTCQAHPTSQKIVISYDV